MATVEAEYGDNCVSGQKYTLAHHGSRSSNPAPCNWDVEQMDCGTILVSHLDLDSIGGILALEGQKIDDPEFWKAAEMIDVNGPHHIHDLPQKEQDKLNAFYAWNETQPRTRYAEVTDVTDIVKSNKLVLDKILDERNPEHDQMIENGRKWERNVIEQVESKLIYEDNTVRVFDTDGVFCAGSYYSPSMDSIAKATVTYNEKFKAITVAFADGGKEIDATKIVQDLWGKDAGGRVGIAGSPRGQEMTKEQLNDAVQKVITAENELDKEHDMPEEKDMPNLFDYIKKAEKEPMQTVKKNITHNGDDIEI
jgi:hypothetical protein